MATEKEESVEERERSIVRTVISSSSVESLKRAASEVLPNSKVQVLAKSGETYTHTDRLTSTNYIGQVPAGYAYVEIYYPETNDLSEFWKRADQLDFSLKS